MQPLNLDTTAVIPGSGADAKSDLNGKDTRRETTGLPGLFRRKILIIIIVITGL